ncbi:HEAT repeat domain-containing protein [Mongoliitalea daihaiensis]|uniref:HEAT repeat domain-containing protein n=1 Tax=Mongoliitalea daihaiensis TaxID=2782006 RepID=UPI001F385F26|nr:HEAT repeat domain-containing protein [Mongoliitalea daihaiensis]UJP63544.1 HEAT repeat domain-containing protein [Mongoliitalea daihaiensis]
MMTYSSAYILATFSLVDDFIRFRDGAYLSHVLNVALVVLLLSVMYLLFQLYIVRSRKFRSGSRRKILQNKINNFLSELIFSDDQSEKGYDEQINKFKKKVPINQNWCRDLLIQNIIDLDRNFKGEVKSKLLSIYFKLGLQDYTLALVKSPFWFYKTKGLYYWRELKYGGKLSMVKKLIASKNPNLRSSALITYISLADDGPLTVLEEYSETISLVEGLNILEIIQRKKIKKPSNLASWLNFQEPSQLIFAVKLIVYYNDLSCADGIVKILEAENPKVRLAAIQACRRLFLVETEPTLRRIFAQEIEENQLEIIKTLGEIGSEDAVSFLLELIQRPQTSEVVIAAMYALSSLDMDFKERSFEPNEYLQAAKAHVLDPYLTQ